MFCPQCHAEYRPGFTRCHDCDVDLVHELNSQDSNESADNSAPPDVMHGFRALWRGTSQDACVNLCYSLRDEGIPYNVKESTGSVGMNIRLLRRYELAVSSDDYQRAKAVLQIDDDLPDTISEDEWREIERPKPLDPEEDDKFALQQEDSAETGEFEPSDSGDFERKDRLRSEAYFRPWYPEDATAEIWSKTGEVDYSRAIEMALKENLIHCRLETEDAIPKVLVLPEQETRAREIVREIIGGV